MALARKVPSLLALEPDIGVVQECSKEISRCPPHPWSLRTGEWDANRPGRNHTEVVRLWKGDGLISAYHSHHGQSEEPKRIRPTTFIVIRTSHSTSTTCSFRLVGG